MSINNVYEKYIEVNGFQVDNLYIFIGNYIQAVQNNIKVI